YGQILNVEAGLAELDTSSSCNSNELLDTIFQIRRIFWVGGNDIFSEGTWVWQHSQENLPLSSSRWGDDRPTSQTDMNCLVADGYYYDDTYLTDQPCSEERYFVCQILN
ncbi:unnamed protein product, partial [Meganyctiphanes norvegica]